MSDIYTELLGELRGRKDAFEANKEKKDAAHAAATARAREENARRDRALRLRGQFRVVR